jgi:hypothetical protein
VAVVDRTNGTCKVFVNGADVTVNGNARNDFTNSSDFEIGRMEGSLVFFGMLDEINLASTLRPAGWILTSYNNQFSPGTFYMVDDAENEP